MLKVILYVLVIGSTLTVSAWADAFSAQAAPHGSVKYFKDRMNVTNIFKNKKTGKAWTQSKDVSGWIVQFKDGNKKYTFAFNNLDYNDSAPFVELGEKVVTPGSSASVELWDSTDQSFQLENGDIVKSGIRFSKLVVTKNSDGSLKGKDASGTWPTNEYVIMKYTVNADGSQVLESSYKNINSSHGNSILVEEDMATIATPVAKDEFLNQLNVRAAVFLSGFTTLHEEAVKIASDLAACLAANPTRCDDIKNRYSDADVSRDKMWSSISISDVSGLEPAPPPPPDDGNDNDGGGGKCPSWGCGPAPSQPPAQPTQPITHPPHHG